MKTYDLEDIEVLELSMVDNPANQHAAVVLFKRSGYNPAVKPENAGEQTRGDGSVTVEELTKNTEALQAQVADLTKKADEESVARAAAEAAVEALTKSAEAAGLAVEDGVIVKRAEPEFVEIDGEKVEKSLVPAPVLRMIEKQAADIAKMQAKAEEVELAKRGEAELPNLAGTALAKGKLLAVLGDDADMLKTLKAADAAMATQYTEKGHADQHDLTSADARLEKMARDYALTKGIAFESAYAEVTKSGDGADLLRQIRNAK